MAYDPQFADGKVSEARYDEAVATTEIIDKNCRVIGISKAVLTTYDRFGNLHDISYQEKGKLY